MKRLLFSQVAVALLSVTIAKTPAMAQEAPPGPTPAVSPSAEEAPIADAQTGAAPSATPKSDRPPPPPELTAREIIAVLSDAQIEQAIAGIRQTFIEPGKADERELRRATLEGLVARLSPGVSLVVEAESECVPTASPFVAEILDDTIGYIRPGAIDAESLSQSDAALSRFTSKQIDAVILDLRGSCPSRDFELAADFARRFCPKGNLLFSVQKPSAKQERIFTSNLEPAFDGVLVVVVDSDTAGAAEALAAALREHANAMVVGARTAGEAVEFEKFDLGDGKTLRVAVSRVALPDAPPIFPGGVQPDIEVGIDREVRDELLRMSAERGVSEFIFEGERPRMNEAALVANTNPEVDAEAFRARGEPPPQMDAALQRAVDLVTAIRFFDSGPHR